MAQDRTEILLAAIEAFNRRDWDAALADAAPDFELDFTRATGPLHGVFGREDMERFWTEFLDEWESFQLGAEDVVEVGDHVVASLPLRVIGRGGVEVISRPAYVCTFREEKITRLTMYQERPEALEAVGAPSA